MCESQLELKERKYYSAIVNLGKQSFVSCCIYIKYLSRLCELLWGLK